MSRRELQRGGDSAHHSLVVLWRVDGGVLTANSVVVKQPYRLRFVISTRLSNWKIFDDGQSTAIEDIGHETREERWCFRNPVQAIRPVNPREWVHDHQSRNLQQTEIYFLQRLRAGLAGV